MAYSLLTDPSGNYRRDSLAAWGYEIQLAACGYVGQLRIGVQPLVGQALREDFVLIPGDGNEVRVQESRWVPSGSERDDRRHVLDREKLETLPVASRHIDLMDVNGHADSSGAVVGFAPRRRTRIQKGGDAWASIR